MELGEPVCTLRSDTAHALRGAERRHFMAQTVARLGLSQCQAHRRVGWDRTSLRKALGEWRSGGT